MSDLTNKILKAVKNNAYAAIMSDSKLLKDKSEDLADTGIAMLNVALSGKLRGGLSSGLTILAGQSKTGKSYISLLCIRAYLKKHPEAICVFFDSELGSTIPYFTRLNIDMDRVVHIPLKNVEELKFQSVKIMEEIAEEDKVIFYLDSIGNLASVKEMEDAQNEKSVADMSRAKQLKSWSRIIMPYINLKKVPFIAVNHTYDSMSFIPQQIMGGGSGILYSADTVLFLSKAQDKDGSELAGYNFKLKVHKSRSVKETSIFCLNSSFEDGIDEFSDLFEFSCENGWITKPKQGWYQKHEKYGDTKLYRAKDSQRNPEFWKCFLDDSEFIEAYEKNYSL